MSPIRRSRDAIDGWRPLRRFRSDVPSVAATFRCPAGTSTRYPGKYRRPGSAAARPASATGRPSVLNHPGRWPSGCCDSSHRVRTSAGIFPMPNRTCRHPPQCRQSPYRDHPATWSVSAPQCPPPAAKDAARRALKTFRPQSAAVRDRGRCG